MSYINGLGSSDFPSILGEDPNADANFYNLSVENQFSITSLGLSNPEFATLRGINTSTTIQDQIDSIVDLTAGTGYWGTFFSSIDQFSAGADTPTVGTFNGQDTENNGVTLFNLSAGNYQSIKVLNGAIYNIQICLQTSSTSSTSGIFRAWFKINGVDIPNSSAGSSHHTNNGYFITTFNVILPLLTNDVLTLYWASSTGATHLEALPAQTTPFVCPSSPSIYVSFQQVTYYQRAEQQNVYGMFQSNTNMTDASPNYVAVKWQSGFTDIRLPDATTTPLGKEYTFFVVNPMPVGTELFVNTYSISQYFYYFGFSDNTTISLASNTQSIVFTCISNSTNPYWSLNQVEFDPTIFFNLLGPNIVPYATTFTQQGTTNPAIKVNAGAYLNLLGTLLVNGLFISPTELAYLDGATSNIQSQLSTLQQKTTAISYSATTSRTNVGGASLDCENLDVVDNLYIGGQNIGTLYAAIGLCYTKAESDVFNQKTTAISYSPAQPSAVPPQPEKTTVSNWLKCAVLEANNYIFVGGQNIFDIYAPRELVYTKTESDNRYFSLSGGNSLTDTVNGILASLASIADALVQIFYDLGQLTNRVVNTETAIDNLETDVNNLTTGLGTLTTQVNNAVSDITGLENITQNLTAVASTSTFSGNLVVMGGSTSVGALNINGDDFNNLLQNQW